MWIWFTASLAASAAPPGPIDELQAPCVRAGEAVWCWGDRGGGTSLAPVEAMRGVTDLQAVEGGVCGLRDGEAVCLDGEVRHPLRGEAIQILSAEGGAQCAATDAGRIYCEGADPALADDAAIDLVALDCGYAALGADGAVTLAPGCDYPDVSALQGAVALDGESPLLCGRFDSGTVRCVSRAGRDRFPPELLAGGGASDVAAVAADHWTICLLTDAGRVRCASRMAMSPPGVRGQGGFADVGLAGVSHISLSDNQLCAAIERREVVCAPLGDRAAWRATPVCVAPLPPMRRAAGDRWRGCGIAGDGALWCWGAIGALSPEPLTPEPSPHSAPAAVARGALAVDVSGALVYWVDAAGRLYRRGGHDRQLSDHADDPAGHAAWPSPPADLTLQVWRPAQDSRPIACLLGGGEARCFQWPDGEAPRALPPLAGAAQVISGAWPCALLGSGGVTCLSSVGERWGDEPLVWDGPADGFALATADGVLRVIDDQGWLTACAWSGEATRCAPTGERLPPGTRAFTGDWWLGEDGSLFWLDGEHERLVLEGVASVSPAGGGGLVALDAAGAVWVFGVELGAGAGGDFGRYGRWTALNWAP